MSTTQETNTTPKDEAVVPKLTRAQLRRLASINGRKVRGAKVLSPKAIAKKKEKRKVQRASRKRNRQ